MKRVFKIIIYILIIAGILQKIYIRQINTGANKIRHSFLFVVSSNKCYFEHTSFFFKMPGCKLHKLGTILQVVGLENANFSSDNTIFDTAIFKKKRLIIESVKPISNLEPSPQFWFKYLLPSIQAKKVIAINSFLNTFNVLDGYLIGKISLGSSQVRSETIEHLFKVTGTQYLASISGFHLNLFINFFTNLIRKKLKKRQVGIIVILTSILYLFFIGAKIPLVRAFLMLTLSVVATSFLLRQSDALHSLFISGICMFFIDMTTISTVSFQLSFVATASIIFFTRSKKINNLANFHISNFNNKEIIKKMNKSSIFFHIYKYIKESIKISIYVQLALVPLVFYYFHEFSLVSLVMSVALTWIVPGLIILGIILFLISLFDMNQALIRLISLPLSFLSHFFISILKAFNHDCFLIKVEYFAWWYVLLWWFFVVMFFKLFFEKKQILRLVDVV